MLTMRMVYCSVAHQKAAWKEHKRACKELAADHRFHKRIALLNMCIQRPGAEDGPTSEILDFLRNDSAEGNKKQSLI